MGDTWTFFGKVHPERVAATCGPLENVAELREFGLKFGFCIAIQSSQVIVDVRLLEGAEPDLLSLRNFVVREVSSLTDIIGYMKGYHLSVEIISAVKQGTGFHHVFSVDIPILAERRRENSNSLSMKTLAAVGHSLFAQRALQDFQYAMREPIDTGFYCYRALEAMMQSFRKPEEDKKKSPGKKCGPRCALTSQQPSLFETMLPVQGMESLTALLTMTAV
jgi:hypothetical protein